ncbi:TylF/MycF/NovP-related O-methyltransferase [Phenylobacterium sp.]|uniref:TylF/MycF/NovP-related O-methyltransferase n=1 Tax=Phenylobacterium sp. TaxID=1871053 RepID=UPI00273082B2|nr:TylF/MycF/NovP-related O-methyltransferase [Phenylobacterium sp.]MDP2215485.1 TylF/MycF/NovP-related O-methyltransferase [Phenylobacterium sp.]
MSDLPKLEHPTALMPRAFYGMRSLEPIRAAINGIAEAMIEPKGLFVGDNLITMAKRLGFLDDQVLMGAFQRHCSTAAERGALWRLVTLVWAARTALRIEGDFVECGCYKGTSARVISEVVDFVNLDRRYYLYDLFRHDDSMPHHSMVEHSDTLVDQVRERFADMPNVTITQGRVPDSLAVAAPEKIAFMHLDLNNADAEIGALEVLFDRISPGGILILDDFGWLAYQDQLLAEVRWMAERGYHILELPTGQGMVIK